VQEKGESYLIKGRSFFFLRKASRWEGISLRKMRSLIIGGNFVACERGEGRGGGARRK